MSERMTEEQIRFAANWASSDPSTIAKALLQVLDERDEAQTNHAAVERELDRWKHGKQVEGDYVCESTLRLGEAERTLDAAILALRSVQMLAKRIRHRNPDDENAGHLLRFCASGGVGESPMDIFRAADEPEVT